jgi:cell division control protein 24
MRRIIFILICLCISTGPVGVSKSIICCVPAVAPDYILTFTLPHRTTQSGPYFSVELATMANVPGRKKSIAANPGLVIETPVANHNNILNKAASQSTSLYQQCSSLRSRLMRIPGFSNFFILSSQSGSLRQSTDPVTQLWDCFSLGISLCFLYELLPGRANPPTVKTDPSVFDVSNERAKKHAIAVFVMNIKNLDNCEQFTVTDLWERHSTDGLVKV